MSKKNQTAKPLIWKEYIRYIRAALTGEKRNICVTIKEILALPALPIFLCSYLSIICELDNS